jgi:hypothetical protein
VVAQAVAEQRRKEATLQQAEAARAALEVPPSVGIRAEVEEPEPEPPPRRPRRPSYLADMRHPAYTPPEVEGYFP